MTQTKANRNTQTGKPIELNEIFDFQNRKISKISVGNVTAMNSSVKCHHLLSAKLTNLELSARSDEILLENVVQGRIQLFIDVLYQKGSPQRQCVLQVVSEVLVVQRCHLKNERFDSRFVNLMPVRYLFES